MKSSSLVARRAACFAELEVSGEDTSRVPFRGGRNRPSRKLATTGPAASGGDDQSPRRKRAGATCRSQTVCPRMRFMPWRKWRGRPREGSACQAKRSLRRCSRSIILGLAQRVAQPRHAILRAYARAAALADYYLAPGATVVMVLSCCCPGAGLLTPASGSRTSHWTHHSAPPRRTAYSAAPNW